MAALRLALVLAAVYLFILLTAVTARRSDMKAKIQGIIRECNKTIPTDNSVMTQLKTKGAYDEATENHRPNLCFLQCIYDNSGMMSDNGVFNNERMKKVYKGIVEVNMPDLDEIIDTCVEKNTFMICMCHRTYYTVNCIMAEEIKRYGTTGIPWWDKN